MDYRILRAHSSYNASQLGGWLSWITALGGGGGTLLGGWIADRWVRHKPRARIYISIIGVVLAIPTVAASLDREHSVGAVALSSRKYL